MKRFFLVLCACALCVLFGVSCSNVADSSVTAPNEETEAPTADDSSTSSASPFASDETVVLPDDDLSAEESVPTNTPVTTTSTPASTATPDTTPTASTTPTPDTESDPDTPTHNDGVISLPLDSFID